jgi:hypothetical protein
MTVTPRQDLARRASRKKSMRLAVRESVEPVDVDAWARQYVAHVLAMYDARSSSAAGGPNAA